MKKKRSVRWLASTPHTTESRRTLNPKNGVAGSCFSCESRLSRGRFGGGDALDPAPCVGL